MLGQAMSGKRMQAATNPWGLRDLELQALELQLLHGGVKSAAAALGVPANTIHSRAKSARLRMFKKNAMHALLEVDRWIQKGRP